MMGFSHIKTIKQKKNNNNIKYMLCEAYDILRYVVLTIIFQTLGKKQTISKYYVSSCEYV